jgi:hypothetical protein
LEGDDVDDAKREDARGAPRGRRSAGGGCGAAERAAMDIAEANAKAPKGRRRRDRAVANAKLDVAHLRFVEFRNESAPVRTEAICGSRSRLQVRA